MSTSTEHMTVPEWDVVDRLHKSLREADMSVNEMALYLGVHRNTVSAWLNGRTHISGPALRAWAHRTEVNFKWLETGTPSPPNGDDGALLLPRLDSNQQPFDYRPATVRPARLQKVPVIKHARKEPVAA